MMLIESPLAFTPAEMVALDDLLLDKAVAGEIGEWLRVWMGEAYFVVLGRHGKVDDECWVERCREDGVEILRRPSGGGTVLQGPGCLNFSVALDTRNDERLQDVKESYQVVLGRVARGLREYGIAAEVTCCVDVAVEGMKISGNAQLRRRGYLLHHGTLLCGFELGTVARYLKHPPKEPVYRRGRAHGEFIENLKMRTDEAADVVRGVFGPFEGTWRMGEEDGDRLKEKAVRTMA